MKKFSYIVTVLAMLLLATPAMAQFHALKVTSFKETADDDATNPLTMHAYMQNGQERLCAIIKVKAPVDGLQFEGRTESTPERKGAGEYWVYMYGQSPRLKVLHQGSYPVTVDFAKYGVKQLQNGKCYSLVLTQTEEQVDPFVQKNSFTMGLGYFIRPYGGPSLSLGYTYNHISFEVIGSIGINSVADMSLVPVAGYENTYYVSRWTPAQLQAHVGYDFILGRRMALTPQVGLVITHAGGYELLPDDEVYYLGSNANPGFTVGNNDDIIDSNYGDLTCWSFTLGTRFRVALSKKCHLQVTPQYNLPISKNEYWKAVSDINKDVKGWADGFSLHAGFLFYF